MNESTFRKDSDYSILKLRDACSRIYNGGTPNTSIKEYWTGNFPWLSSGETNNRFIKNTKISYRKLELKIQALNWLGEGVPLLHPQVKVILEVKYHIL